MALEARPVHRDHLTDLFRLRVTEAQAAARLVAPAEITLAQQAYEPEGAYVWGLWDGETAVGLMAMIDCRTYEDLEEGDDPMSAYLWRLHIGAEHQGKGHGRAAMGLAEGITRDWGLPTLYLTHVDTAESAAGFYERLGYRTTGRLVEGEVERVKVLGAA